MSNADSCFLGIFGEAALFIRMFDRAVNSVPALLGRNFNSLLSNENPSSVYGHIEIQVLKVKERVTLSSSKKRIIVIDDDKSILRTFTRILQKNGYEIDVAETGKEAIEKSKKNKYDLALIDIRLPDMDGTDLLMKMRQTMSNAIKIMITGFPSLETGVKALDEGADAYLVKPVKPEELLALIEEKFKAKAENQ